MTFLQNSTINRKSFRHRKVDNKKPLRIYTPGEINEDDCIPVSRAGIEIETGVEKEEEEEWHLVHALKVRTESMEKGATASGKATIPVPTSSRRISYYADVYQTHKWKKPSTYVKFSLPVEECIGCLYCMDERDDKWLAEHKQKSQSTLTEDKFEEIMQHFENVARNKPQILAKKQFPSWQDCEALLPELLNDLRSEAEIVYTHWKSRRWERMKQYQKAGPLMFEIKTQEGKDEEDHPWTCFRRRELKPIRRTRRTETASFDKLRKIRKDIHSGRRIMVDVTVREKTKKQKIELDRKIFEKECTARELRKKLGIRNETSHEQPKKNRKSSFAMDLLGATKTKSGIKLSKKDDEYPMTDITEFPYLIQRKPVAATFFRKFESLKPSDRNSISCMAFRSRFGRGGRRRRIIDRLDVFSYRRIRETNDRYKYDSDGIEDIFSDDEINQLDDDEDEKAEEFTENMIRFHLFKEEDYQNLGVYRRIQKEKQNSPTKQQSLDALTGNNIPAQNPQHASLTNAQTIEQRTMARSNNAESRTTSQLANQDPRQKLDSGPRSGTDLRLNMTARSNIPNVDPRTYIDPHTFNGVNRNQSANTESNTSRGPHLNSNSPSTPRLSSTPRLANNGNIDPRAHNGLILRPTVTSNHRDSPYRRPMPRNSSNTTVGGVTNVVATQNGIASSLITGGSIVSSHAKNTATAQNTPAIQINSSTRTSNISDTNGQGNGNGLTRTSSSSGLTTNGAGQMADPSKSLTSKILMNAAGQMLDPSKIDPSKITVNNTVTNQIDAQKINNVKITEAQQPINTSIQSTPLITQEQFSQFSADPGVIQQLISLYKHGGNQRQSVAQTPRQNIIVPSVGSNVPNSAISLLPHGMVPPSIMRQNNVIQSSGSSSSTKPVIAQNFALANGFNISPTSGASNTINVNPNASTGANGSQQSFIHPNGIVNLNSMGNIIPTNGQTAPIRTNLTSLNGRNFIIPGTNNLVQLNGTSSINLRPNLLTGNGLNMVLPVNSAINSAASSLANINRHQLATNPNLRQGSTNSAAIRHLPNGSIINANLLAANNNFGTNLTQMRAPQQLLRQSMLGGGYDLLIPSQSPRQNNASVATSNGGNNAVGAPSPQPQTEQRTVR